MYHSKEDFVREIVKIAQDTSVGDTEDQGTQGQQSDATPELLQPDEGPGSGPRGEHESLSTGAEKAHKENREGGYLPDAFDGFNAAARQSGAELSNLLDNFGPKAIVSSATPQAGVSKIGSVRLNAFTNELEKICEKKRKWTVPAMALSGAAFAGLGLAAHRGIKDLRRTSKQLKAVVAAGAKHRKKTIDALVKKRFGPTATWSYGKAGA